jgi:chromosome segregation ATPase
MADNNANGNPQAGEPGAQGQPQAGNPTPTTPPAGESDPNKQTYTKEEYDRLQRNKHEADNEAKNLRARLKALESEKEKAEAEQLAKQGEFKTLYEQSQAKITELQPVVDENNYLRDYAMKQLEATIKDWPEEVKAFDPGKKASLQARLDWLEKSKPLVAKLMGQQQQQRQAGAFRSPLPANNQQGPKTAEDYYKELKAGRPF